MCWRSAVEGRVKSVLERGDRRTGTCLKGDWRSVSGVPPEVDETRKDVQFFCEASWGIGVGVLDKRNKKVSSMNFKEWDVKMMQSMRCEAPFLGPKQACVTGPDSLSWNGRKTVEKDRETSGTKFCGIKGSRESEGMLKMWWLQLSGRHAVRSRAKLLPRSETESEGLRRLLVEQYLCCKGLLWSLCEFGVRLTLVAAPNDRFSMGLRSD